MRVAAGSALALALAAALSGCADFFSYAPTDPVERAAVGAAQGAAAGASIGVMFAIDPGLGALVGAGSGAAAGAAVGAITAEPAPSYAPIAPASAAVVPGVYDSWPPGDHGPPLGAEAPPPPNRAG